MSPLKAFGYYHSMHLHFTKDAYSILKYGSETAAAKAAFNRMTQGQKYKFDWMSRKFQTTQDMVYACLGAELSDIDCRFARNREILDAYFDYKSRRESLARVLKSEYDKYISKSDTKFHQLIFNYFAKQYNPEFILLIDHETNYLERILDEPTFSFARPKILKLIKYKNFFSPTKYLPIIYHEEPVSV